MLFGCFRGFPYQKVSQVELSFLIELGKYILQTPNYAVIVAFYRIKGSELPTKVLLGIFCDVVPIKTCTQFTFF